MKATFRNIEFLKVAFTAFGRPELCGRYRCRVDSADAVAEFTALGADEVVFYCWSPDTDQVDRLADVVG